MGFWADLFGTSGQHTRGKKARARREAIPGPYFAGRAKIPPFGTPPRGGAREQAAGRHERWDAERSAHRAQRQYNRSADLATTARRRPR